MKHKFTFLLFCCLTLTVASFAQKEKTDQEEKDEKRDAREARIKDKTDYNLFHRQMLALKEYHDERAKIPNLQKANKVTVKVTAVVDTTADMDDDAGGKILTGYIRQDIGDNSSNVYEVTFDRVKKKIATIKRTGEGEEVEKADKTTPKKTEEKKTIKKKNKDDDDDDDTDDAPAKKEKDDDKE